MTARARPDAIDAKRKKTVRYFKSDDPDPQRIMQLRLGRWSAGKGAGGNTGGVQGPPVVPRKPAPLACDVYESVLKVCARVRVDLTAEIDLLKTRC